MLVSFLQLIISIKKHFSHHSAYFSFRYPNIPVSVNVVGVVSCLLAYSKALLYMSLLTAMFPMLASFLFCFLSAKIRNIF